MVKRDAPALLEEALSAPRWEPQSIALSGNTDCYQPVERVLRLTRACLEVFLRHRNPVSIITKNALILRDIDLLAGMVRFSGVRVLISMITLSPSLTRVMEPRTAAPSRRLQAMEELARAGIPVGVNIAPVIPGLTDEEIPAILTAAKAHGARFAGWSPVRLPGPVEPLFTEWIKRVMPDRAERVLHRIREIHGGKLNDSRFGSRMSGEGTFADVLDDLFTLHARKVGLDAKAEPLSTAHFRRKISDQLDLFQEK